MLAEDDVKNIKIEEVSEGFLAEDSPVVEPVKEIKKEEMTDRIRLYVGYFVSVVVY